MVVGVDRVSAPFAADTAFRIVDRCYRKRRAHILERKSFGNQFGRIELYADCRLLLPTDQDLGDTGDLADLLGEFCLDVVIDFRQRKGIRGRAEQKDGRVCRIDLAIGGRARKIFWQLPARRVDRGLDVVCRSIDIAFEDELNRNRRRADDAGRGHLRNARDLCKLCFQRLGHRRGHGVGACAGQGRVDLDGGEIDLGQGRHRQARIGDKTNEQHANHQ